VNKAVGMIPGLVPTGPRCVVLQEQLEFRFEASQCLHVHVHPPGVASVRKTELALHQSRLGRRRSTAGTLQYERLSPNGLNSLAIVQLGVSVLGGELVEHQVIHGQLDVRQTGAGGVSVARSRLLPLPH
jgi:hypothetical protein